MAGANFCARSKQRSLDAARCALMAPSGLTFNKVLHLCEGIFTIEQQQNDVRSIFECAERGMLVNLAPDAVAELCRTRHGLGPVECTLSLPLVFRTSQDRIVELCRDSVVIGPAKCASEASVVLRTLSANDIVVLCRKVSFEKDIETHLIPVRCMQHLWSLSSIDVVEVCAGATSLTPAFCALSVSSSVLSAKERLVGRNQKSVPTEVKLHNAGFEGESIYPGTIFWARVSVLDQFGQMYEEETVAVAASIREDPVLSSNHTLHGTLTNGTSPEGLVLFNDLFVNVSGNFTLEFRIVKCCDYDRSAEEQRTCSLGSDSEAVIFLNVRSYEASTPQKKKRIMHIWR